jgi:hypothetical protein
MQSSNNIRSLLGDGNRRTIRREDDKIRLFFVDQYSPILFVTIVVVLFLCVIDALLTLFLIDHGAYEINPIMKYYLNVGPYVFFTLKYALTFVGIIFLLIFRNIVFRKIKLGVRPFLYFIASIYMVVIVWEIHLAYNVI